MKIKSVYIPDIKLVAFADLHFTEAGLLADFCALQVEAGRTRCVSSV